MKTATLASKRLQASTLVEVLVALVIITLVMAVAATLYAKMAASRPDNTVALQLHLNALAQTAKREGIHKVLPDEINDNYIITKELTNYNNDTLLLLLELKGTKVGTEETATYREIIIKSDYHGQ